MSVLRAALRASLVASAALAGAAPAAASPAALTDEEVLAEAEREAEREAARDATAGETIHVEDDAPAASASSVELDAEELRRRPATQPSDLLRQVPGLVVSQHAGGGKADQYFIRGFDADHGTDVALFADGVPVNLTSHGHGQGYADAHWVIPEAVAGVAMHKGPYAARYGDFYTAGALELRTIDEIAQPTVWLAGGVGAVGGFHRRVVGMASPRLRAARGDHSLIALQVGESDGPFVNPQDYRNATALLKWQGDVGPGRLAIAGTFYRATWDQSGQLPEGEIAAGRLDRFGAVDPSEGGRATRASLQLRYGAADAAAGTAWRVRAYGVSNDLQLFSNFTLFARDEVDGDGIEQTDDRLLYGGEAAYEARLGAGAAQALVTAGVQLRGDDVQTSLWHQAQRTRLAACFAENANPCNRTDGRILTASAFAEAKVFLGEHWRLYPGLRADAYRWRVTDLDPETAGDPMTTTGGRATAALVSPKLSVEYAADRAVSLFANAGLGFHSNDARAAVAAGGRGALARAIGGEVGARMRPHPRARVSADVWYLHLASEQVWSGDAGGTEPSDPTRRLGLDLEGSLAIAGWLALDANVTWAKATVVASNGGALALAPRWMGSGGASAHHRRGFVSLRARGIADRAGNADGSLVADGYLVVDVVAGTTLPRGVALDLTITNLLDTPWREAQFAEASRVAPGAPIVEQMHYTPGLPLTATLTASYRH